MRLVRGKVVGGKVELEGERLMEGAPVIVLTREDDETFELSPQQDAELARAIEEADRGELIDGDEFLRDLSGQT